VLDARFNVPTRSLLIPLVDVITCLLLDTGFGLII
jgi:hypothetical protein